MVTQPTMTIISISVKVLCSFKNAMPVTSIYISPNVTDAAPRRTITEHERIVFKFSSLIFFIVYIYYFDLMSFYSGIIIRSGIKINSFLYV